MAWIKTGSPAEAQGRVAEIYAGFKSRFGAAPNIVQAFSLKPELLAAVARVFQVATFGGSKLTRVHIVTIASLFNFIDRVADALGVELDPMMKQMAQAAPEGEALTEVAAPMRAHPKADSAKGT